MEEALTREQAEDSYNSEEESRNAMLKLVTRLEDEVEGGLMGSAGERVLALTKITAEINEDPKKFSTAYIKTASLLRYQAELERDYYQEKAKLDAVLG